MARYLAAHPCPDGILAANDVMAIGVLRALEAAGKAAAVTGVNALPEAIDAIKAGRMLATADFDALKISCLATEAAVRHLRGEAVPAEILLPVRIVDRDNCLLWDRPIAERPCPRWDEVVGHGRPDAALC
jgi:ribose transport system substrate-binding protein